MSRLRPIKPLLRQLADNAYRPFWRLGRGHAWTSDASLLRSREDLHSHHLDPAVGELGELGEPVLDVRHRVMGLEISLVGEDFIKYEMARRLAIFLEEIDEIFRVASDQCHKWQRCGA